MESVELSGPSARMRRVQISAFLAQRFIFALPQISSVNEKEKLLVWHFRNPLRRECGRRWQEFHIQLYHRGLYM